MSSRLRAPARALLRGAVYPAVEAGWAGGFALIGRLNRAAAQPWTAASGHVGIVAPHPDDETGGCGGVACLHRAAGDAVGVLILTDGGASRAGGLDRPTLITRRAAEAQAAAAVLGATLEQAGLPEGTWSFETGVAAIRGWLCAWRPVLVYAPSCVDYHPEHLRVARALAAALRALPDDQQPAVRVYEVFVPLGAALVNCLAALGPVAAMKAAALACYASQQAGLAQVRRRDRYLARRYGLPGTAEGFCALTARQYAALIAAGDWSGRASPFRGLRGRPLSDPLAYWAGWRARRRLARAIA